MRQSGNKISKIRIDQIRAGGYHLVGRCGAAEDGAYDVNIAVTEFERVAIADGDYVFARGLMRLKQVGQEFSLRRTLGADTRTIHRIVDAQQRAQMIHDHGEWQ